MWKNIISNQTVNLKMLFQSAVSIYSRCLNINFIWIENCMDAGCTHTLNWLLVNNLSYIRSVSFLPSSRFYRKEKSNTFFRITLADSNGICTLAAVSSALKFAFRRAEEDSGQRCVILMYRGNIWHSGVCRLAWIFLSSWRKSGYFSR